VVLPVNGVPPAVPVSGGTVLPTSIKSLDTVTGSEARWTVGGASVSRTV
jgi:hypothetical protein